MIRFWCKCGQKIAVDEKHAGRHGKCPKCGAKILVPAIEPPTDSEKIESIPLAASESHGQPQAPPEPTPDEKPEPPAAATHKPEIFDIIEVAKPPAQKKPAQPIKLTPGSTAPQQDSAPTEEEPYEVIEEVEEVVEQPPPPSPESLPLEQGSQPPAPEPEAPPAKKPEERPADPHKPEIFDIIEIDEAKPKEQPKEPIKLMPDTILPQQNLVPPEEESCEVIEDVEEVVEEPAPPPPESLPLERGSQPATPKPKAPPPKKPKPQPAPPHKPEIFDIFEMDKATPRKEPKEPVKLVPETAVPQKGKPIRGEESYDLIEDVEEASVVEGPSPSSPTKSKLPSQESVGAYDIADQTAETGPKLSGATVGVCLNCGKPVSIQAYQQLGYYCSTECKNAVRVKTGMSQMSEDTERAAATLNVVRTVIFAVIGLAAVGLIGLLAYFLLPKIFKPQGTFTLQYQPNMHMSSLSADDGSIYVVLDDGRLNSLDSASLGVRWTAQLEGASVNRVAPVPVPGGVIAATTAGIFRVDASGGSASASKITSIEPDKQPFKLWEAGNVFAFVGPPDIIPYGELRMTYSELDQTSGYTGMGIDSISTWPARNPSPGASYLVAVDPQSATELWRTDLRNAAVTDLIVRNGQVWFATTSLSTQPKTPATLVALDMNSGDEIFRKPLDESYGWHFAQSDVGVVAAGIAKMKVLDDGGNSLFDIDPPDGSLATRVVVRGNRLIAKGGEGKVCCYDLSANGELVWSGNAGRGVFPPAIFGDKVLVSGIPQGKKAPEVKQATTLAASYKATAEQLSEGVLVPKPMPDLTCFDLKSGRVLWVATDVGERFSHDGKFVYALWTEERTDDISHRDRLFKSYITALNPKSGAAVWGAADKGTSKATPLPYKGHLYIHLFHIVQSTTTRGTVTETYENRLSKVEIK